VHGCRILPYLAYNRCASQEREISRFLPCFLGKMAVFDKTEPLVMMPCEVLSLLPSRLSCPTRRSCLYRMQMEHMTRRSCRLVSCPTRHAFAAAVKKEVSNEKELRESHANGAHGETELPDEAELPDETELPDENGQRGEPSIQSVWGSVIFQAI